MLNLLNNLALNDASHEQFAFNLFVNHKTKELNAEMWPVHMQEQVCKMQYQAFNNSLQQYSNQKDFIIDYNSEHIGRIIYSETETGIHLIYIAILLKFQGKGFAKMIINDLIQKASINKQEITLKVTKNNPAFILYKKMGFIIKEEDQLDYFMYLKTKV